MVSIFLTTGLVLGVNWYKPQTKSASPTDMRIVGGLSSVFCDQVKISSNENITAYLLDEKPEINRTLKRRYTSLPKVTIIKYDQYEYWGYYLLAGSNITVHSCVEFPDIIYMDYLDMYVIKGSDNFKSWQSNMDCDDCYMDVKHYRRPCDWSYFHGNNYTIHIIDTDDYYFTYANTNQRSAQLTATFDMYRTTYIVKGYKDMCQNAKECKFSMSLGSSETAVFYVPETDSDDRSIYTRCEPRMWLYFLLFCFTPLFIGSISCFVTWKTCDKSGKIKPIKEIRPSVWSVSSMPTERVPFNKITKQSPPSYEEALQGIA